MNLKEYYSYDFNNKKESDNIIIKAYLLLNNKIMNPQEKAAQLIDEMYNTDNCGIEHYPNKKFCDCSEINLYQAKQCAIIAVKHILDIKVIKKDDVLTEYWEQVLEELNK